MNQVLLSVCCSPQNEHMDIKKLQVVMSGAFKKDIQNSQKFMFFFLGFLRNTPQELTTMDTSIINSLLKPLWPVDLTFGSLADIV